MIGKFVQRLGLVVFALPGTALWLVGLNNIVQGYEYEQAVVFLIVGLVGSGLLMLLWYWITKPLCEDRQSDSDRAS
jgi:uncharacterized protein YqgC (DUF456 family)